jgi:hypothetical protein
MQQQVEGFLRPLPMPSIGLIFFFPPRSSLSVRKIPLAEFLVGIQQQDSVLGHNSDDQDQSHKKKKY